MFWLLVFCALKLMLTLLDLVCLAVKNLANCYFCVGSTLLGLHDQAKEES